MTCKIDLRDMITAEANSQGVPPEIAIAVAVHETGMCHWSPNGKVVRGRAGEIGVMQLMPSTAAGLGVDAFDVNDNINGGVRYLRQLYDRYGDWSLAVQHYNGSGPAAQKYASLVMARARNYGFGLQLAAGNLSVTQTSAPGAKPGISKNTLIGIGIVAGAGLFAWAIAG